ncbi:MAG: hypothetical protein Q8P22_05825 [Chloroflexota bacterium]|nr:hypothetical protein [Chloroflexota bacterium]
MSTRSVIARVAGDGFCGRYHHWDGYPNGLGKQLWDLYQGHFRRDLKRMLQVLLDEHPAGWSTIVGKDFTLAPGYTERLPKDYEQTPGYRRPQCYCHGDRHEEPQETTQSNAARCGCEWAYVFDDEHRVMHVLGSFCQDGRKMIGMFGMGDPDSKWGLAATVQLDGPDPDWGVVECGETLER